MDVDRLGSLYSPSNFACSIAGRNDRIQDCAVVVDVLEDDAIGRPRDCDVRSKIDLLFGEEG